MSEPISDNLDIQLVENNNINPKDVTDSISMSGLESSDKEKAFSTVNVGSNDINAKDNTNSISMSELDSEMDLDKNLPLVYAIGELGYDFGTETRLKSFSKAMGSEKNPKNPSDLLEYLRSTTESKDQDEKEGHPVVKREDNFPDVTRIIWTLEIDTIPIYAIRPSGPFSEIGYRKFLDFLDKKIKSEEEQKKSNKQKEQRLVLDIMEKLIELDEKLSDKKKKMHQKTVREQKVRGAKEERQDKKPIEDDRKSSCGRQQLIAIPGRCDDEVTLLSGQKVQVIIPEFAGMFKYPKIKGKSEIIEELGDLEEVVDILTSMDEPDEMKSIDVQNKVLIEEVRLLMETSDKLERSMSGQEDFTNLLCVHERYITKGLDPKDRALNFVATNAINQRVISDILNEDGILDLDKIEINEHPLGLSRPGSELFEAKIYLVDPSKATTQIRKTRVYRVIVDVADVIPVFVGKPKKWNEYPYTGFSK